MIASAGGWFVSWALPTHPTTNSIHPKLKHQGLNHPQKQRAFVWNAELVSAWVTQSTCIHWIYCLVQMMNGVPNEPFGKKEYLTRIGLSKPNCMQLQFFLNYVFQYVLCLGQNWFGIPPRVCVPEHLSSAAVISKYPFCSIRIQLPAPNNTFGYIYWFNRVAVRSGLPEPDLWIHSRLLCWKGTTTAVWRSPWNQWYFATVRLCVAGWVLATLTKIYNNAWFYWFPNKK